MVRILESVLAASLYAFESSHVVSETSRDWNVVVAAVAGSWGGARNCNVRYHPTLNLSFAILSPVSSAAADP